MSVMYLGEERNHLGCKREKKSVCLFDCSKICWLLNEWKSKLAKSPYLQTTIRYLKLKVAGGLF